MEPTYKCRCGQNLLVLEGERKIRCGTCGETINLPAVYWKSEQPRRPEPQSSQPKIRSRQRGIKATYKCHCGTTLFVWEGEKQIRCGRCGETHNLPEIDQKSKQSRQLRNSSISERQAQTSHSGRFSVRKMLSISILAVFAGFGLLVLVRGCSDAGQLSSLSSAPIASFSPTASPTSSSSLTPEPKPTPKPKPVQRPTDDNGVPFPTKSGYLKGYPALSLGGYSNVTVDNSQNNSDVFVKLFSLDTTPPKAARVFFIRAHDTFTVEDIKPGNYDVRYRDLTSEVLSRTEQFNLKEVRTARGVQFSRLRLTLYKVLDGNMQIQPISEGEF